MDTQGACDGKELREDYGNVKCAPLDMWGTMSFFYARKVPGPAYQGFVETDPDLNKIVDILVVSGNRIVTVLVNAAVIPFDTSGIIITMSKVLNKTTGINSPVYTVSKSYVGGLAVSPD